MKSLFWLSFEIAINLFESILFVHFFKSIIYVRKNSLIADGFCALTYTAFLTLYLFFDIPISDSIGCFIFYIYLRYISRESAIICALWVILKEVLSIASVGFMLQLNLTLLSVPYELISTPTPYRIVFLISGNFVLFIEFYFFSKFRKNHSALHIPALLLFFGINISVLILIELIFSLQVKKNFDSSAPFFLAYSLLILCSVFSVILFYIMTSLADREQRVQVAFNQAQLTKKHQQVIQNMYTNMLKQEHDIKHHLQTMEQLVLHEGSAAAKTYLLDYQSNLKKSRHFLTGSIAVDALLIAKSISCEQYHIELQVNQCPLSELPISDVDFCSILGNLLDNAIEGNNRIHHPQVKKWIHLSFSRVWDMFTIRCENPFDPSSIKRNNHVFLSSKSNLSEIHGFGILNIKTIVDDAEGFCKFDTDGTTFLSIITLPYPLQEED